MKGPFQDLPKLQGQVFPEVGIWDLQAKVASHSCSRGPRIPEPRSLECDPLRARAQGTYSLLCPAHTNLTGRSGAKKWRRGTLHTHVQSRGPITWPADSSPCSQQSYSFLRNTSQGLKPSSLCKDSSDVAYRHGQSLLA